MLTVRARCVYTSHDIDGKGKSQRHGQPAYGPDRSRLPGRDPEGRVGARYESILSGPDRRPGVRRAERKAFLGGPVPLVQDLAREPPARKYAVTAKEVLAVMKDRRWFAFDNHELELLRQGIEVIEKLAAEYRESSSLVVAKALLEDIRLEQHTRFVLHGVRPERRILWEGHRD